MVKLSTSNLLWYIYQRNCEVGYPTVISMSQFCAEFPEATRKDIINELDNLINGMHFIHRRFLCVYDLTEEGLEEALHLRNFVVNPCKQVWWVRVLQIIVRRFYSLKKVTALIFIVSSLSLTLSAEVTNEAAVSISGNLNGHIVYNTQMEILKNRISLLECMFDSQKNEISQRCAQEVARVSDRLNIECARQIGVVSDKYESEFDRQSGDLKCQYEVAYKNLRDDYDKFTDRLGNWLTGIGIFVALFGVVLPIVMTIIEHCKTRAMLRWARDRIGREIVVARNSQDCAMQIIRKDGVEALHMCLAQGIVWYDLMDKNDQNKNDVAMSLMSILLCFYKIIEASMRTNDEALVRREIQGFRKFADRWSTNDDTYPLKLQIWNIAVGNMKNAAQGDYQRGDYAKMLGENSDEFNWLMQFLDSCFHGKFL